MKVDDGRLLLLMNHRDDEWLERVRDELGESPGSRCWYCCSISCYISCSSSTCRGGGPSIAGSTVCVVCGVCVCGRNRATIGAAVADVATAASVAVRTGFEQMNLETKSSAATQVELDRDILVKFLTAVTKISIDDR